MKLLFDENLSSRLCAQIADLFPGSSQARLAGLAEASDRALWAYAKDNGFTIVSLDADFAEMATLLGTPPKVIWLRCGNQPSAVIETCSAGMSRPSGHSSTTARTVWKSICAIEPRCLPFRPRRRLIAQRVVDAFLDQLQSLVDALRAPVVLVFHPALALRLFGRERGLLCRRRCGRRWRRGARLCGRRCRRCSGNLRGAVALRAAAECEGAGCDRCQYGLSDHAPFIAPRRRGRHRSQSLRASRHQARPTSASSLRSIALFAC